MHCQDSKSRWKEFLSCLQAHGVGLAYFLGSQKELEPALLRGEEVVGAPDSDLDLGVVLLEHPWIIARDKGYGNAWKTAAHPSVPPCGCISCSGEEENAHVQYAAIRGIRAHELHEDLVRQYRRQVLTLYGDWHSWWP
jgi:hypothetical protein